MAPCKIGVAILGATGSIGQSALEVLSLHSQRYEVVVLTAYSNVERMLVLYRQFRPQYVVMVNEQAAKQLRDSLGDQAVQVLSGSRALEEVVALDQVHYVLAAIVGGCGLLSCMASVQAGKRLLLANKEALVMAGHLFMQAVAKHNAQLLPVDSEHNAILQLMPDRVANRLKPASADKIILTASGGPFRQYSPTQLQQVTPKQAITHPNWDMGKKISVDSATMMNKGLEVIEAHWLFNFPPQAIQVVIHPQSIVHSMISHADGSVLAQLGHPDMRTAIACCLAWPDRMQSGVKPLDMTEVGRLDFHPPDPQRFPCLHLAYEALHDGDSAPTVLNAANEVAVEAFLKNRLRFVDIAKIVEQVLDNQLTQAVDSLEAILELDKQARSIAIDKIKKMP